MEGTVNSKVERHIGKLASEAELATKMGGNVFYRLIEEMTKTRSYFCSSLTLAMAPLFLYYSILLFLSPFN